MTYGVTIAECAGEVGHAASDRVVGERETALSPVMPGVVPAVTSDWRTRMLSRLNAVRREAGVRPVEMCPALTRSAQHYAKVMATEGFFDHVGPDGSQPWDRMAAMGYRWRQAAENIAAGQPRVYEVMQAWRSSARHLASMTDPEFTHVGFGHAAASSGPYPNYWVQDFGAGGRC